MKSICAIGTMALVYSSMLLANEIETKEEVTLSSEVLSLPELLTYVEETVQQVIHADDEICQFAYHELEESLRVIYTFNCLHQQEASTILQALDKCYVDLIDAIDNDLGKANILEQSLLLFANGRNYDHETLNAESFLDWTDTLPSNQLTSAIEASDADLVYIHDNVLCGAQENIPITVHPRSRLLYRTHTSEYGNPKILIIKNKSDDSPDYKFEVGRSWRMGGKDHGKSSSYMKGEVKDKDGNYAEGKISKESDEDGYDCDMKAGKEKKK